MTSTSHPNSSPDSSPLSDAERRLGESPETGVIPSNKSTEDTGSVDENSLCQEGGMLHHAQRYTVRGGSSQGNHEEDDDEESPASTLNKENGRIHHTSQDPMSPIMLNVTVSSTSVHKLEDDTPVTATFQLPVQPSEELGATIADYFISRSPAERGSMTIMSLDKPLIATTTTTATTGTTHPSTVYNESATTFRSFTVNANRPVATFGDQSSNHHNQQFTTQQQHQYYTSAASVGDYSLSLPISSKREARPISLANAQALLQRHSLSAEATAAIASTMANNPSSSRTTTMQTYNTQDHNNHLLANLEIVSSTPIMPTHSDSAFTTTGVSDRLIPITPQSIRNASELAATLAASPSYDLASSNWTNKRGATLGDKRVVTAADGVQEVIQVIEVPIEVFEDVIVKVPQVQEVVVHKPVVQEDIVYKEVPVREVKEVEIPHYTEKIEWVDVEKRVRQEIPQPVEVVREVKKQIIEKVVKEKHVPGDVIERVKVVEQEQLMFNVTDQEVPTVVSHSVSSVIKDGTDLPKKNILLRELEPVLIPVTVHVPALYNLELVAGTVTEEHRIIDVSVEHWNSLVRELNPGMPTNPLPLYINKMSRAIPYLQERVVIIPPRTDTWKKFHVTGQHHVSVDHSTFEIVAASAPLPPPRVIRESYVERNTTTTTSTTKIAITAP